jgi:dihydrofolate reductase
MRKLIVSNIVSLDGYIAGPGENVMALPMDHRFDRYNLERMQAAETMLVGANSFRGFNQYWPSVADDPEQSEANRGISRRWAELDVVVVSDSLGEDETDPWRERTEIVRRVDAHERIASLKEAEGGDILTFASRTLWNDLLAAGLVDELHFMIGGLALGDGVPAFSAAPPEPFRLLGVDTWDDSDNLVARYATTGARPLRAG